MGKGKHKKGDIGVADTTKVVPTVELDMESFREDILQAVHFGIRAQAEAFLQHAHAGKRMMEQMSVAEVISEFLEFCNEHPLTGK